MKRATVDTNFFISALFWKGIPEQAIEVFKQQQALLLLTDNILAELERKLSSSKFASRISAIGLTPTQVVNTFRNMAELVTPADVPEDAIRDPKDRIILACAVGGEADLIVSGDNDLLTLESYQGISIVSPSKFVNIVTPSAQTPTDVTNSE